MIKKDYSSSVIYAEKFWVTNDDNVKVMLKLSLVQQCKRGWNKARSGYAKLLTIAKGELAAEASIMMLILK
jgi:hypothetical protein